MTSLGLTAEDVTAAVTKKEPVVVQVAQVATLSPTVETQETGNLGVVTMNIGNTDMRITNVEGQPVTPIKKCRTNEANVRRPRSPSPRLQRSTSLGVLRPDGRRTEDSPRRRDVGLRLPSFRGLGISSLEPKYLNRTRYADSHWGSSHVSSPTHSSAIRPRPSSIHHHASEPFVGSTPLLTPPEDSASIKWHNALHTSSGSSVSHCEQCVAHANVTSAVNSMSLAGDAARTPESTRDQTERPSQSLPVSAPEDQQPSGDSEGSQSWLDQAVEKAVSTTATATNQSAIVNVVAHVLPLPADDTSPHHQVFTAVIQAVQEKYGPDRQPYITITHAVPHKFDLNSLPTSPPATPNIGHDGGDYFSPSVFAHAAVVPSYHAATRGLSASTSISSSPTTIVPPASVQMAILERYIPPTSVREYGDLFSTHGRSVLVDRLSELSSNNGTLMFIYPTKTGATTFSSRYLSPVLTPILLNIVNLNRLVFDLAEHIGIMGAIPEMNDFDTMKAKINTLCQRMSDGSRFNLVHSSKGRVSLDHSTWREWYVEQEQGRIREVLKSYWKQGRRLPGDTEVTDATISRAIIDGLRKGVMRSRLPTGEGVEVGVFVIRRIPAST